MFSLHASDTYVPLRISYTLLYATNMNMLPSVHRWRGGIPVETAFEMQVTEKRN
jgi:hypothetical protein